MKFPARATVLAMLCTCLSSSRATDASWWLTNPDKSALLAEQPALTDLPASNDASIPSILVDHSQRFQTMDGFGFALTGGSAQNLMRMTPAKRHELLKELFSLEDGGIGISYLRLSIGSSDLNARTFSYDDIPAGATDPNLEHFTLSDDLKDVVPVLKEILTISPKIKIMASPWSAPVWMKTNGDIRGGKLKESCYPAYAGYFVRYIQAMWAQGITIDAVTVQNEPFNDLNTPSMQLFPKEEASFVRDYLGPYFKMVGLTTKIILYDHNCDAPQYPVSILTDPEANKFVDGSGFHLYGGDISALSVVHDRFPDKNIYFTEQAVGGRRGFNLAWPISHVVVGATRNWSKNVLLWNLASDPEFKPHTDNGGCASCQGALTLDGDTVERKLAYYVLAHASKFVPPGSVRISSSSVDSLSNVAFRTPDGRTVVIVANTGTSLIKFQVEEGANTFEPQLGAGSVATLKW
ncbi:MAG TPA: glycoside hydrolase family 30 beta sandwich domain-containing protein [Opitutaceae bacterium]|jgi:glucosylceramidase|nr:glycoside hydrolase family 30 beta sandwich domain-containing protein [Opitutaceae bacterium]